MKRIADLCRNSNSSRFRRDLLILFVILLYWELLLYSQLHSSLRGFSFWNALFVLPIAFFLLSFEFCLANRPRYELFFNTVIIVIISFFYLADLIYYKTFGSLFSVAMLGTGTDAITSFWWSIPSTLKENIFLIFCFEIPVLLMPVLVLYDDEKSGYSLLGRMLMLFSSFVLWNLIVLALPVTGKADYSAYGVYHSRYTDTDTASAKLGALPNFIIEAKSSLFGFSGKSETLTAAEDVKIEEKEEIIKEAVTYNEYSSLDFREIKKNSDNETVDTLCDYLVNVSPSNRNEYTGLFEGYDLIYICAESFSSLAIDEQITPTLYKLANNGIVLNNYYNSFKNVTTNGEYAFLTGLWPDVARKDTNNGVLTGTMGQSIDKDMSMALGNMFNRYEGIQSRGYHNYYGYYYGRNQTLPNMGFDCKFMDDGMSFTTAWPASDLEMMEQSVDDYINDDQYVAYYMTFSGHGNYTTNNIMVYRNYDTVNSMIDTFLPSSAIGYLSCNYELEKAMTYLLERLEEAGRLDRTVIVLTGDHYPYYLTDPAYEALKGEEKDEDFESYHSTCIIYNAGLKQKIEVDTPCCNVDILPTVLNLFAIPYDSRLYAGIDIFSDGFHAAQLYNRSFITDKVKYDYTTGRTQWLIDTQDYDEKLLESYLESAISTVKNRYAMSIEIEDSDFYDYVTANLKSVRTDSVSHNAVALDVE